MHKHITAHRFLISILLLANVIFLFGFSPTQVALAQQDRRADLGGGKALAKAPFEDPLPTETPWVDPAPSETATIEPTAELLPTATETVEATPEPTLSPMPETPFHTPMEEVLATNCSSVTEIPSLECTALVKLFNSMNGTRWGDQKAGWLSDNTPCDWTGVTCSGGHVTELSITQTGSEGKIAPEIGSLTYLKKLNLSGNNLKESIPSTVGNLSELEVFNLSFNNLEGTIPVTVGDLSNLVELNFFNNSLAGSIPAEFGALSNLRWLNLDSNRLSGSLPPQLGNLVQLTSLRIAGNDLTGQIPAEFANLTNLTTFQFDAIHSVNDRTKICLPDDALLEAWFNAISSKPSNPVKCSEVFSTCSAVSQIPEPECQALTALYESTQGENWTHKYYETWASEWLGDLTPCDWYGLSCENGHITRIWLRQNNLVGTLPVELGNLQYLQQLEIQNNILSGSIPPELGSLTGLKTMNLSFNQLTGSIPAELGNLTQLTGISLSNNRLSGNLPPQLGNLTLATSFSADHNRLMGSLPPELGSLSSLRYLDISSNIFSGSLPIELTQVHLRGFDFSDTNVCIPAAPTFLTWLNSIDQGLHSNGNYCYPASPVLISPEGNQSSSTVTFRWHTAENALDYQVYVFNNNAAVKLEGPSAQCQAGECEFTFGYDPYCGYDICYDIPAGDSTWRVKASNPSHSSWSNALTLNVPPAKPVLRFPADGDAVSGIPVYQWEASAAANLYEFQCGTSDDFNSGDVYSFTTTGLSHQPPVQPLGEYLWRVRARNAQNNWGLWSAFRFVEIQVGVPPAPLLSSPEDGAWVNTGDLNLNWGASTDGHTYQIQMDTLKTFASPDVDVTGAAGVLTYAAGGLLDGQYFWRVRAINHVNTAGTWSLVRSFTIDTTSPAAPKLSSPGNNAVMRAAPKYIWKAVSGAARYQMQYDDDVEFENVLYTSDELIPTAGAASISFTPDPAQALGLYSWRVRAKDAAGNWGPWSEGWQVDYRPTIPVAPLLIAPDHAALLNDNTPRMAWSGPAGAAGFEILVDTDAKFLPPLVRDVQLDESEFTAPADAVLPDGKLYWKVRAKNSLGEWGSWSGVRTFTLDTQAPAAPLLVSPASGSEHAGTPTYRWLAALTAKKYRLQIDTVNSFDSGSVYVYEGAALAHTPPPQPEGDYYWRVQACDEAGNCSSWSETRLVAITTGVPLAPVLIAPLNNAATNDPLTAFDWDAAVYGERYELAVDTDAKFSAPVYRIVSDLSETEWIPDSPLESNKYYWRVRARNANGAWGVWSAARSFILDTTPIEPPERISPQDGEAVTGTPTYIWDSAAEATHYQFRCDDDDTFADVLYTSAVLKAAQTPTQSFQPPYQAEGLYYWQVRSREANGNWSGWGAPFSVTVLADQPTAPLLGLPAANSTVGVTPTFTWSSANYGRTYQIQLDDSSLFDSAVIDFTGGPGELTYTVPEADHLTQATYYWRVRAYNVDAQEGVWSAVRTVKVDSVSPAAPALITPANAAIVYTTPVYKWKAAATAVKYEFQYASSAAFTEGLYSSGELPGAKALSHQPPVQSVGIYYWRARACDAYGNWSGWSDARTVDVRLSAPILTAPAKGAAIYNPVPTFTWNALPEAANYQIQIDNASGFGSPEYSFTTGETSSSNYGFTAAGTYYWRVRGFDANGEPGAWSAVWSLKIKSALPE